MEVAMFLVAVAILGMGLYFLGPSITGFVIKEASYEDNVNLVVTSNGNYTLELDGIGELKSLKLDGMATSYGKSKVYVESNGIRYLVFDSARLGENKSDETQSNETNLITGFASKEDEEKEQDKGKNETGSDKDNKEKNKKPKWNGENEFIINGTISINLSQHFIDEDGDSLIYSVSEAEGVGISIDDEIVTIEPDSDKDANTTTTFIASDGIDSKSQTVKLIVIVEIAKTDENKAPKWISDIDSFHVNWTTLIELSDYFIDEDNDNLSFNYGAVENITISLEESVMTLEPESGYSGNSSTIFTAFDGKNLTIKSVLLIVPEMSLINVTEPINETNQTINQTPTLNETNITYEKTITINLSYNKNTVYDANDNGEESINGVVDLSVAGTKFGWEADESKLCTRWEVYNAEEGILTALCNGNSDCCGFLELLPTKSNWSEIYYSTYGKDGAGYGNKVAAQVLHYDVNLSPDNPKSEIYNSEWGNLSVKFFEEEAEFFDECIETCLLAGLNKSSYTLIFEVEDDAVLRIDKIKYSLLSDVENTAPRLVENITIINISKNRNATINLSKYFIDEDGDKLNYDYYKADNITIVFDNDIATIVPDKKIEGIFYTYITANDSDLSAVSNLFMINISQEFYKPRVEIGKPVKWEKTILIDVNNITSVNLTLHESASNISITIINQSTETYVSEENIKIIEDGEVKDKELYELQKQLEEIKRNVGILEEANAKNALSVEIDGNKYDSDAIDAELNELYIRESALERELRQLTSLDNGLGLLTANVIALSEANEFVNETQPILIINESLAQNIEITVEYETEAPIAIEEQLNENTKQIKIVSDTSYENVLSYTTLNDVPQNSIKLYWVQDNERALFTNVKYYDDNENSLIDRIEWVIPHLSNQTFEVSITVLNVQSYPTVGGTWTVGFNTTGTGNLSIYGYNGTSYAEKENDSSATVSDLDVLELKCGADVLEPYYIVDLGELELSGFEGISGNAVKEIEEKKAKQIHFENLNSDELKISDTSTSPSFNVISNPSKS